MAGAALHGLDVAGASVLLFQKRKGISIYQAQSDPVMDAALRRGRLRFGNAEIFSRDDAAKALVRAIRKRRRASSTCPTWTSARATRPSCRSSACPAATLLAPSRLAQALTWSCSRSSPRSCPAASGYRVRYQAPWSDFPSDDPVADTARMNRWIEREIRRNPAQYLWVHERFKTRPPGEPSLY